MGVQQVVSLSLCEKTFKFDLKKVPEDDDEVFLERLGEWNWSFRRLASCPNTLCAKEDWLPAKLPLKVLSLEDGSKSQSKSCRGENIKGWNGRIEYAARDQRPMKMSLITATGSCPKNCLLTILFYCMTSQKKHMSSNTSSRWQDQIFCIFLLISSFLWIDRATSLFTAFIKCLCFCPCWLEHKKSITVVIWCL